MTIGWGGETRTRDENEALVFLVLVLVQVWLCPFRVPSAMWEKGVKRTRLTGKGVRRARDNFN